MVLTQSGSATEHQMRAPGQEGKNNPEPIVPAGASSQQARTSPRSLCIQLSLIRHRFFYGWLMVAADQPSLQTNPSRVLSTLHSFLHPPTYSSPSFHS